MEPAGGLERSICRLQVDRSGVELHRPTTFDFLFHVQRIPAEIAGRILFFRSLTTTHSRWYQHDRLAVDCPDPRSEVCTFINFFSGDAELEAPYPAAIW